MAALASSDVTVSLVKYVMYADGGQKRNRVSLAFGDSAKTYPSGGIAVPAAANFGLIRNLETLVMFDGSSSSDIHWKWDYTNQKLRGYRQGHIPQIIVEEAVTLTSNAGTLRYPPAYILAATATISAATVAVHPIPLGETPATKQFTINWNTGAVLFLGSDSASAVQISYIPQQMVGFFSLGNMVIDEPVTLSSSADVNLANQAGVIQYIYQHTATAARLQFAHAAASGKVLIDISNSGASTIKQTNAAQDAKVAYVTYLKYAGLVNTASFIDQATVSLSSQAKEWGAAAGDRKNGIMLSGTGMYVLGNETTNYLEIPCGGPSVTAAVGLAKFDILVGKITTAETTAQTGFTDQPLFFMTELYNRRAGLHELTTIDAVEPQMLYAEAIGW